jgi:hypothetical protein
MEDVGIGVFLKYSPGILLYVWRKYIKAHVTISSRSLDRV